MNLLATPAESIDLRTELRTVLRDHEYRLINLALRCTNGNQCKAARMLKIHRNTLGRAVREMRRLGVLTVQLQEKFRPKFDYQQRTA